MESDSEPEPEPEGVDDSELYGELEVLREAMCVVRAFAGSGFVMWGIDVRGIIRPVTVSAPPNALSHRARYPSNHQTNSRFSTLKSL